MTISRFSKGMLQRIGFAQALVNDPDLVMLDEPLTGLDPVGRREIRDLILDLRARGKTVFISSHILQDVEMICDRVGILAEGRILRVASIAEVLERSLRWTEVEVDGLDASAVRALGLSDNAGLGDKTVVHVAQEADLNSAITALISAGGRITSVVPMRLTLEDYFLSQIADAGDSSRRPPGVGGGLRGDIPCRGACPEASAQARGAASPNAEAKAGEGGSALSGEKIGKESR
jgi:ABC-2 type transport system ATP-binding protein